MKTNNLEFLAMNNPIRRAIQKFYEYPMPFRSNPTPKFDSILEIGCGSGYGAQLLSEKLQYHEYKGIDIDEKMISLTKKRQLSKCDFISGSVTKLPFNNSSFDLIVDFGILHHIPDWRLALSEIRRVLIPNGLFVFEDFTKQSFESFVGKVLRRFLDHPYDNQFSKDELLVILSKEGFQELSLQCKYPLGVEVLFGRYQLRRA